MNRALKTVDDMRQASQDPQPRLHAIGAEPDNLVLDIYLRASVVGPVLEEILQSQWETWEHWGLNE